MGRGNIMGRPRKKNSEKKHSSLMRAPNSFKFKVRKLGKKHNLTDMDIMRKLESDLNRLFDYDPFENIRLFKK